MKKALIIVCIIAVSCISCDLTKPKIDMSVVIKEKVKIDKIENPAQKLYIQRSLSKKRIVIKNVVVKEITTSTNIDYDFCVIVDVNTSKGPVECFIYSKNINKIAKLKKGKSKIDMIGEFSKFFTMLDEYFIKIEIIKAKIRILDTKK